MRMSMERVLAAAADRGHWRWIAKSVMASQAAVSRDVWTANAQTNAENGSWDALGDVPDARQGRSIDHGVFIEIYIRLINECIVVSEPAEIAPHNATNQPRKCDALHGERIMRSVTVTRKTSRQSVYSYCACLS
jgi:hypothetical protein